MLPLPAGVKLRRTWPQRLFITVNIIVVMGCFAVAAGLLYVDSKTNQIQRISLSHVLTATKTESTSLDPMNILLVGVDDAEGLDPDDPVRAERDSEGVGGLRSDTVMVLRVDPADQHASLVSFPRDLWVEIGTTGRRDKINAAMTQGGPSLLISTIQENFGIPIDHYVQVDFASFRRLVQVIDGVNIYFDTPVRDFQTGLDVSETGCVTLNGDQALAYARSRYFEYQVDGEWEADVTSDLGRISRQQDFVKRALARAVSKGVRNPFTLNQLINTGLDAVVLDDGFKAADVADLANRFRSFDPSQLETFSLPVVIDNVGEISVVRLLEEEARPILDRFRGIEAGSTEPSSIRVRVLNGSGRPSEASITADALSGAGFVIDGVGDAVESGSARTTVRFTPAGRAAAEVVGSYLDPAPRLVEDPTLADGVIVVATGLDLIGLRDVPRPTTTTTPPPSTSTTVGDGDEVAADTSSTSTTRYGVVPGADNPAASCS